MGASMGGSGWASLVPDGPGVSKAKEGDTLLLLVLLSFAGRSASSYVGAHRHQSIQCNRLLFYFLQLDFSMAMSMDVDYLRLIHH